MQLQENTLFANRYQLIRLLGRGGFSEVWLAKDNWTRLQIALKVYAPGQGMDQDGLQDFCGELASVYDLNHTNLLKPQHVDTWENMPYLIMAYCPAGSCVKRVGKMTEAELWKLIHDVAAGLAYLHEKDVVHQDIKPDNILMDTEGNYLITDFGISTRARSTLRKSVIGGSTSGGTTAYMGPERFSRQPAPTKASDIWSFGAMAFELLEGVVPFGEIGGGLQKGGAEIPFINANVSDELKFTIFKMLSKETWDRPTAATLIEWANDPSAIEVDYDLLTEESNAEQPQPAPAPAVEEVTTGRETKRHGAAVEPELTISVTPKEIHVPAAGGNSVVYVNTNGAWVLPKSTTQPWIRTNNYSDNAFTIKFEANKTGKTREYSLRVPAKTTSQRAYEDIKISQPSLPKKSKAWLVSLIFIIPLICVIIGVSMSRAEQRENIRYAHSNAVYNFNQSLQAASIDNIEKFEDAYDYLSSIRYNENQSLFNGSYVSYSKTTELKNKLQSVYNELERKYQAAPSGTNLEKKLKQKRDKVYSIKQKL